MTEQSLVSLRKQASHILQLPSRAQETVSGYLNIRVGGAATPCPYHINPGLHSASRALLGKGNPSEIEAAATKHFDSYAMHVNQSPEALRAFLIACGIGVDCSGFASWVLDGVTRTRRGLPIWKCIQFSGLRRKLAGSIHPIQNISARLLTSTLNTVAIDDLATIQPADLMRAADWHHVLVVTEVGVNEQGEASYFQYAQSSCMYGAESGVRSGYAIIKDRHAPLVSQQWFDGHPGKVIERLLQEGGESSRVVRLKALV